MSLVNFLTAEIIMQLVMYCSITVMETVDDCVIHCVSAHGQRVTSVNSIQELLHDCWKPATSWS